MKTVGKLLFSSTLWHEHDTDQRTEVLMWGHLAYRQSNDRDMTKLYSIDKYANTPYGFLGFFIFHRF